MHRAPSRADGNADYHPDSLGSTEAACLQDGLSLRRPVSVLIVPVGVEERLIGEDKLVASLLEVLELSLQRQYLCLLRFLGLEAAASKPGLHLLLGHAGLAVDAAILIRLQGPIEQLIKLFAPSADREPHLLAESQTGGDPVKLVGREDDILPGST